MARIGAYENKEILSKTFSMKSADKPLWDGVEKGFKVEIDPVTFEVINRPTRDVNWKLSKTHGNILDLLRRRLISLLRDDSYANHHKLRFFKDSKIIYNGNTIQFKIHMYNKDYFVSNEFDQYYDDNTDTVTEPDAIEALGYRVVYDMDELWKLCYYHTRLHLLHEYLIENDYEIEWDPRYKWLVVQMKNGSKLIIEMHHFSTHMCLMFRYRNANKGINFDRSYTVPYKMTKPAFKKYLTKLFDKVEKTK